MATLDELEMSRQNIKVELDYIEEKIREEKLRIVKEVYGVEIGSVVVSSGREYVISNIKPFNSINNKPWVSGTFAKKDGTQSKKEKCLYSKWELKK